MGRWAHVGPMSEAWAPVGGRPRLSGTCCYLMGPSASASKAAVCTSPLPLQIAVCRVLVVGRATYASLERSFPHSARLVLHNLKRKAESVSPAKQLLLVLACCAWLVVMAAAGSAASVEQSGPFNFHGRHRAGLTCCACPPPVQLSCAAGGGQGVQRQAEGGRAG